MNETVKEWSAKAEGDFCARLYRIALQQLRGPRDFLNREDAKSTKVLMFSPQLVAD